MTRTLGQSLTLILLFGLMLSFAAAQAPQASPPPLVPCEDAAEGMPCVDIVTEVSDIVGVWRRYLMGAIAMGFTEYREDGSFTWSPSLQATTPVAGTIRFEDGVAAIAASPGGPALAECREPGRYELRLIRVGEQPVALSYTLVGRDRCLPRVDDFSRPMIYYTGSGEELEIVRNVAALAQPLVACPEEVGEAYPCDMVVTRAEDAAGIWKQYVGRPDLQAPDGMGYLRINRDGSFIMADSPENTATVYRNYPYGRYAFEGGEVTLTVEAPDVPPVCQTAIQRFHVYRYGEQPVALLMAPIEDNCPPRLQNASLPFIWVAAVD